MTKTETLWGVFTYICRLPRQNQAKVRKKNGFDFTTGQCTFHLVKELWSSQ